MAFVVRIFHPWADYCPLKWRAVHAMIRAYPRIIFFLSYLPSASPWNFVSWSLKLSLQPFVLEKKPDSGVGGGRLVRFQWFCPSFF